MLLLFWEVQKGLPLLEGVNLKEIQIFIFLKHTRILSYINIDSIYRIE